MFAKHENENGKCKLESSEQSYFTLTGRVSLCKIKAHQKNVKISRIPI